MKSKVTTEKECSADVRHVTIECRSKKRLLYNRRVAPVPKKWFVTYETQQMKHICIFCMRRRFFEVRNERVRCRQTTCSKWLVLLITGTYIPPSCSTMKRRLRGGTLLHISRAKLAILDECYKIKHPLEVENLQPSIIAIFWVCTYMCIYIYIDKNFICIYIYIYIYIHTHSSKQIRMYTCVFRCVWCVKILCI